MALACQTQTRGLGKWALTLVTAVSVARLLLPSVDSGLLPRHWHWETVGNDSDGIEDALAEFRSEDNIFPRAREWHGYWTYASRKGNKEDHLDDSRFEPHMHDDYVASAVKSASKATLKHIDDMKRRYESVGALPDFYARGIGWIKDVSLRVHLRCKGNFFPCRTDSRNL